MLKKLFNQKLTSFRRNQFIPTGKYLMSQTEKADYDKDARFNAKRALTPILLGIPVAMLLPVKETDEGEKVENEESS